MTASSPVLLDTDVLSAIMRRDRSAVNYARQYLSEHQRFTFSVITRYEVLRGLLVKGATSQRAAFDRLCMFSAVLPINEMIVARAAEIYADLYRRGELIGDADILIAATALTHGHILATNNVAHLGRIPALRIQNWLTSNGV